MDLSRYDQTYRVVRDVADRTMALDDAEDELERLLWNVHPDADPNAVGLGGALMLLLAERDRGHRDDESVIAGADALTRNQTIAFPNPSPVRSSGNGRVYNERVAVRIGPRVVVGQGFGAGFSSMSSR